MEYVDEHDDVGLYIFELTVDDENFLVIFDQMISLVGFKTDCTACLLFDLIKKRFLFLHKMFNGLICEEKLCFYFGFGVIELRRFFFDCVCDGGFLFKNFIYHFARFCDIAILTLNFGGSICHLVDWLINYDFCVGLAHDFVNLVAFGSD